MGGARAGSAVYWANDLFSRRAAFNGGGYGRIPRTSCCPEFQTWPFAHCFIGVPPNLTRLLVKHGSQVFAVRLRRHRRARRYTLRIHPSDREAILTMPPRGSHRRCEGIRATPRRLDRRASRSFAESGAVPDGNDRSLARRRPQNRASRRPRHGVDRDPRQRRADPLRRRRRRAHRPPRARLPEEGSPPRSVEGRASLRRSARRQGEADLDPRPVQPLGFLHLGGVAVVLVAADPGAALRAGLSRRARGRPSGRDEPFAPNSGAWSAKPARRWNAPRPGSTPTATTCTATASASRAAGAPPLTEPSCSLSHRDVILANRRPPISPPPCGEGSGVGVPEHGARDSAETKS